MFGEFVACMITVCMFFGVCAVCFPVVVYVFPKIPCIRRWMDSLPNCDDKEDFWE